MTTGELLQFEASKLELLKFDEWLRAICCPLSPAPPSAEKHGSPAPAQFAEREAPSWGMAEPAEPLCGEGERKPSASVGASEDVAGVCITSSLRVSLPAMPPSSSSPIASVKSSSHSSPSR